MHRFARQDGQLFSDARVWNLLRTPTHKCTLKTQEIEQVAHEWTRARIAVAGVRLASNETALEAEEVEEVERASTGRRVAIGVALEYVLEYE